MRLRVFMKIKRIQIDMLWQNSNYKDLPDYVGGYEWVLPEKKFIPAYLEMYENNPSVFEERCERALSLLKSCTICPRLCKVNRLENQRGVCRSGRFAAVCSAFPHLGEEDGLRGWMGSGTIFFSYCNLKCVFCQNHELSWRGQGAIHDAGELARMMISLQEQGCHNINFVTPEHVVPQIMEALPLAIEMGLRVPLVYNTSAYDSMDSMELMDGIVDIYMPDFKYWDSDKSRLYLGAGDYPEVARKIFLEMYRQVGSLRFDEKGLARRGLLVRHLVMPGETDDSRQIFRFLAREISRDTWVNIMDQYRPDGLVLRKPEKYSRINRGISSMEYRDACHAAMEEGLYRFDSRR
jgi:putative pyruvate formate lyase activating enzyme